MADYREVLLRLKASVAGIYDCVLLCHGQDGQGSPDLIDSVISVCDDILRGETDDMPFQGFMVSLFALPRPWISAPSPERTAA